MDPLERIREHLNKTNDPIHVILRAHLLVEERLRDILEQISRAPEELRPARLSFQQAFCVCRAVVGRQSDPAWDFIGRLNEVRNRIAHHLDPGDLDELLGSVITKLRTDYANQLATQATTPLHRFRLGVMYTCGYLDSITGSPHLKQAYSRWD